MGNDKPASAPPADGYGIASPFDPEKHPVVRPDAHGVARGHVHPDIEQERWSEPRYAASAQVREGEPKYFDDVLHPDDPRRSPCVAADDTPSKSRANRIALEKGEPVAVAQDMERWMPTPNGRMARWRDDGGWILHADHARIVSELRDSVDVAQQEIDELRLHNSKQEASLAACRADAERLDYIERTFSGMTNRERYLPVQMIWGKGCNGRTLREACDKYMRRDAARSQP